LTLIVLLVSSSGISGTYEKMAAGMASKMASTQMPSAVKRVTGFVESRPDTWRRIGFTMAQYLSALRAVSVNTETPIDTSLAHSDTLQINSPYGQDSSCNNYRYSFKIYVILQSNKTFYCKKYISKLFLKGNDNYMLRLSFLSHLQFVTLGYFNMQLTLLLSTRSLLHKFHYARI